MGLVIFRWLLWEIGGGVVVDVVCDSRVLSFDMQGKDQGRHCSMRHTSVEAA